MKIKTVISAIAVLVGVSLFAGSPALAAGSDAPTPYSVTAEGITLPDGDTFPDNGHVNIKITATGEKQYGVHFEAKCIDRTDAECAGTRHEVAQFIGKNFIPWSAFGLTGEFCVTWVQIHGYNQHYGEGGQPPVCQPPAVPEKPKPNSGVEEQVNPAVCIEPLDGTAVIRYETRPWTQDWTLVDNTWVPGDKVYGDWTVVREEAVPSEECKPTVVEPPVVEPPVVEPPVEEPPVVEPPVVEPPVEEPPVAAERVQARQLAVTGGEFDATPLLIGGAFALVGLGLLVYAGRKKKI